MVVMSEQIRQNFVEAIGNTPLLKLGYASALTKCHIYGKAEFLNPGGSIKDRAALGLIQDYEKTGQLKKGTYIVEGTAGNTGIALTLIANSRGYKTIIVMPETQSQEKKDILRNCGADLRLVEAVPYKNPKNYVRASETLVKQMNDDEAGVAVWANQFDNIANRKIHYSTTGPEIWRQTGGKIDGFICSAGTGGTIAGVSRYLKEHNKKIVIALADPMGSALYHYFTNGELLSEGSSISEGIGNGRITKNLEGAIIDKAFQVHDAEALDIIFTCIKQEGYTFGTSTGINISGAITLAKELGEGSTVVTVLCDSGFRYQNKIFNKKFLQEKNLPYPQWL